MEYKTHAQIEREQIEKYMEEHGMEYVSLQKLINEEQYKLNDNGVVVWRSGMDAGSFDPNIGRHISEYIKDWKNE